MGFVRVLKNKAYFKRFQVRFRRRREAKTDYYARHRLIVQDKNKYLAPKYRFVVRISNRDVTCQIFSSALDHDVCIASAYAHELKRYGITVGLTNYAACYATGLLLARRVNEKFKLAYKGNEKITGEVYSVMADFKDDGAKPFKAYLDVGLVRTTTGNRVFGALKGAADGGIEIPHNERRFPGSSKNKDSGEWSYDPEVHKKYIFGQHVANYMKQLKDEDEERYQQQFSRFIKAGVTAEKMEALYKKAHELIRKDPLKKRDAKERGSFDKPRPKDLKNEKKRWGARRLTSSQRAGRIKAKLASVKAAAAGAAAAADGAAADKDD
jgi:large subunit ribosomal protein L5e